MYGNQPMYNNQVQYSNQQFYSNPVFDVGKVKDFTNKFIKRNMIMRSLIWFFILFGFFPLNIILAPIIGIVYELIYNYVITGDLISNYLGKNKEPLRVGRVVDLTEEMCSRLGVVMPEIYTKDCIKADAFVLKEDSRSAIIFSSNLILMANDDELRCVIAHLLRQLQLPECSEISKMIIRLHKMLMICRTEYSMMLRHILFARIGYNMDRKFANKRIAEIRDVLCNYSRYESLDDFAVSVTGNPQAMVSIMNKINSTILESDWKTELDNNNIDFDYDASAFIGFTFNDQSDCHLFERAQSICSKMNMQQVQY